MYGTGGQTRAFIHICDTVKCIEMAINNPPKFKAVTSTNTRLVPPTVEIYNQMAETRTVSELAQLISNRTKVPVRYMNNPRNELINNDLKVSNLKFK